MVHIKYEQQEAKLIKKPISSYESLIEEIPVSAFGLQQMGQIYFLMLLFKLS